MIALWLAPAIKAACLLLHQPVHYCILVPRPGIAYVFAGNIELLFPTEQILCRLVQWRYLLYNSSSDDKLPISIFLIFLIAAVPSLFVIPPDEGIEKMFCKEIIPFKKFHVTKLGETSCLIRE